MISTGGTSPLDMARLRLSALEGTLSSGGAASPQQRPSSPASPFWGSDLTLVEGSERLVVQALDSMERGRAYVDEPRVFLGSWFLEPNTADGLSRETDLLIDSVRVLLPEPTSVRAMADRQLEYGALQSALETETTLRLAAAWDAAGRTVVSTSLAMGSHLTVLAPSDVQRLPAGSAGALRRALRGGDLVIVAGDVATATAWWTVARSGFVRAIVEPGAGMSKVAPVQPGPGAGKRHPGQQGGNQNKGAGEYIGVVRKVGEATKDAAAKGGRVIRDGFDRIDPAKAKLAAKLLAGQ